MKKINYYLMMAFLATGMIACSDNDSSENESNLGNNAELYMSFNIAVPETRTATGSTVPLEGTDAENTVSDVQVVLVDKNGVPFAYSTRNTLTSAGSGYTATFQSRDVLKNAGKPCDVYIVCNGAYPTGTAAKTIENATYEIKGFPTPSNNIWEDNNFLMTSAKGATSITLGNAAALALCNTPADAFELGSIDVERSAVRFDYREKIANNIYPVTGDADNGLDIQLVSSAVVNASKSFYYLRRVSADGKIDGAVLGGAETADNYVVDTDAAEKLLGWDKVTTVTGMDEHFFNYANKAHNYGTSFVDLPAAADYTKIHYATENTLPQTVIPQEGNTTAVVFKAKLVKHGSETKHKALHDAMDAKHNLYVFNNKMYGDWDALTKYVVTDRATNKDVDGFAELEFAYQKAKTSISGTPEPTLANAAAANFKVYKYNTDGYYVYYYYWNKHNDKYTTEPIASRHMEYGTVRNNVYRLIVDEISKFGHPEDPDGDTDIIDPDNPIDPNEVYFKVTVSVLKWTVRDKSIKF